MKSFVNRYTVHPVLLLLLVVLLGGAGGQSGGRLALPSLPEYVSAWADVHDFSGVVVVHSADDTVVARAFGSVHDELGVPTALGNRFSTNHFAEYFTLLLIGELVERGSLELDTRLRALMPAAPIRIGEITVRQLLDKNAGLDERTLTYSTKTKFARFTPQEVRAIVMHADQPFAPGEGQPFFLGPEGNTQFSLLASVVDATSGNFESTMTRLVFEPAGLLDTTFSYLEPTLPGRAQAYYELDGVARPAPFTDESYRRGAGGVYSTAADLVAFIRHLDTRRQASTAVGAVLDRHVSHVPIEKHTVAAISMDSWADGFSSFIVHAVEPGATMVVLSNRHAAVEGYELRDAFYRWIVGEPLLAPRPSPWATARALWAAGDRSGARGLINEYMEEATHGESVGLWPATDHAVREALRRSESERAVVYAEFFADLFPDVWFTSYSLGRTLQASCDVAGAMHHYRLALQAAPEQQYRIVPQLARLSGAASHGDLPEGIQCHR